MLRVALALAGYGVNWQAEASVVSGLQTCGDVKDFYKSHSCCGNPGKKLEATGTLTGALATQYYVEQVIEEVQQFLDAFNGDPGEEVKKGAMIYPVQDAMRVSNAGVLNKYQGQKKREISALCGVFDWCNATGLPQCDMTYSQKAAMHRLLNAMQSEGGYQTMRGIMNSHRIIGEFEEWANAVNNRTFLGEVWQAMLDQGRSVANVSSQNFWDLVDSLGLDTSGLQYMPLAGKYIGPISEPPPLNTSDRFNDTYHGIRWGIWTRAPGFAARLGQFCLFNIALFAENTSTIKYGDTFGVRFEGHHFSLSMLYQYTQNGYVVQNTPLLVGMFPVQSPPGGGPNTTSASGADGCGEHEYDYQAKWVEGQNIMRQSTKYFQMLIESLPRDVIDQIHIPASTFLSAHPFRGVGIPNEYQFLVSSEGVLTDEFIQTALSPFPHAFIPMGNLSTKTKWAALRGFQYYTTMMAPEVAAGYLARVAGALANPDERVLLAYAGDAPFVKEGHFFILIEIEHLLIELTLSPEWSLTVRPESGHGEPISNHIHSLIRDMRNQWTRDPLAEHLAMSHHEP